MVLILYLNQTMNSWCISSCRGGGQSKPEASTLEARRAHDVPPNENETVYDWTVVAVLPGKIHAVAALRNKAKDGRETHRDNPSAATNT